MPIKKENSKESRSPPNFDFSAQAIKKVVISTSFQHPAFTFPMAVAGIGTLAACLFNPAFALVALGAAALGAGSCIFNLFFRDDVITKKYLDNLKTALAEYREAKLRAVQASFEYLQRIRGAENFCAQAHTQFDMAKAAYESLLDVLRDKLNETELTFTRYMATAEQVYLSILDNLCKIASTLKSVESIDVEYIQENMARLTRLGKRRAPADERELEALLTRSRLRETQLHKVQNLLVANEEALTQLSQASAAISAMTTEEAYAAVNLDTAMAELKEMAKRSSLYK